MKIIPSNQTLILASERGMSGSVPTLRSGSGDAALRRVTILASRPDDSLLYLQADYASTAEYADAEPSNTAPAALPVPAATGLPARISPPSSRGNPYSASRGAALYASTQGMLYEAPMTQIDVHA